MRPDADDLARFERCFAANGSPKRPETLRWQYLDNPTQQLFVDFALAGDDLAAIYATLPVRVRLGDTVRLAVQSVDTITDAAYRGKGLFLQLARRTYARASEAGAALVYGFPNGNSAHGFYTRLDWSSLDPVPFLVRPLRTRYIAARLKLPTWLPDVPLFTRLNRWSRHTPARLTTLDDRLTDLWHAVAHDSTIAVERDAAYLRWRLSKPHEDYRNHVTTAGDRITAFVSHTTKDKHGGRIGYLMEHLARPDASSALRHLITNALADMTAQGADVALAWCLPHSPPYRSLLASGFVPFPERYRPIELHAGVRAFHAPPTVHERARWYLSYLDSDTV